MEISFHLKTIDSWRTALIEQTWISIKFIHKFAAGYFIYTFFLLCMDSFLVNNSFPLYFHFYSCIDRNFLVH
jgi:hypothetical protein